MDLYRTLWETSFDLQRGHDRTLHEFFVFDRLITSKDDWVVTLVPTQCKEPLI